MYKVPKKVPTKIRISFVGDSITQGNGASLDEEIREDGWDHYLTNGAKLGYRGYPYKFWQLLKKKNISDQFELLNFGFLDRHLRQIEDMRGAALSNSYF